MSSRHDGKHCVPEVDPGHPAITFSGCLKAIVLSGPGRLFNRSMIATEASLGANTRVQAH
jgi:hypothetical protein